MQKSFSHDNYPCPEEWTRSHFEQAAKEIVPTTIDRKYIGQIKGGVDYHLEKFGFFSIAFDPSMIEVIRNDKQRYEEAFGKNEPYGCDLIETNNDLILFIYDRDFERDPVGLALLKKACIDGHASYAMRS